MNVRHRFLFFRITALAILTSAFGFGKPFAVAS